MIDPYENISIGNFLYSLGLHIGKDMGNKTIPGVVNLLQQTPADKTLTDVMLSFPGVVRLIEFKRESNTSEKEVEKREVILNFLDRKYSHLKGISKDVHWYIESAKAANGLIWNNFVSPYIDVEVFRGAKEYSSMAFSYLLQKTASDVLKGEEYTDDYAGKIKEYFDMLANLSDKQASSSGVIVCASQEKGVQYIPVRDFKLLNLTMDKVVEFENAINAEMQRAHEQALEKALPSKSLGLGW